MFKFLLSLTMGLFMTSFSETSIAGDASADNKALQKTHLSIAKDHRTVRHIDVVLASELTPDDAIFYDVRDGNEYEVSHISGRNMQAPTSRLLILWRVSIKTGMAKQLSFTAPLAAVPQVSRKRFKPN